MWSLALGYYGVQLYVGFRAYRNSLLGVCATSVHCVNFDQGLAPHVFLQQHQLDQEVVLFKNGLRFAQEKDACHVCA